jgi:hypothetical protein
MARPPTTWLALLCGGIASLAGVVAAVGVTDRGDGSVVAATSERGVAFDMATTGVYAHNAQRVVAEGVGWDLVTLFIAVPALFVGAWLVGRGSFRGQLFTLGVLGYLLYQYLEYAVTWAFGPLFLGFVVLTAATLLAITGVASLVARAGIADRFSEDFPRVGWTALSATMSVLLCLMWLARIKLALDGDLAGAGLASETTLTVQALDLGLLVPVLLLSAALAWQRSPTGYALATSLSVMFVGMAGAIVAMLISAAVIEAVAEVVPIAIFGIAGVSGLVVAIRAFRSIVSDPAETTSPSLRPMGVTSGARS